MKILALDLGDKWVGTAIADPLGITCRPLQTLPVDKLDDGLQAILEKEPITTIVVGYPKTVSGGTHSAQTEKILAQKDVLASKFTTVGNRKITWVLWDERFSSKRAAAVQGSAKGKEAKLRSHSIAASFILQNYLDHLALNRATCG